eukprot:CAMPEP_0194269702 /NCGR_PEP_ID=MMETSP0169-20130528/3825_1 /TAXON_ID=218684 /ORGANISM="Corethron pennatum, Strain L29A3" /LENGTH=251 /DNA_ID=CAMNT_0039011449 /DNA_START=81 /DNA_END=836 /DNA_ORIENTATION=-
MSSKSSAPTNFDSSSSNYPPLPPHIQALVQKYDADLFFGLEQSEARRRCRTDGNLVPKPIQCPKWVCCLLPCIKYIPSMVRWKRTKPEDVEVLRRRRNGEGGSWIVYDVGGICSGDVVRIREGDIIPADLAVVCTGSAAEEHDGNSGWPVPSTADEELSVDHSHLAPSPRAKISTVASPTPDGDLAEVFYGGMVLHGAAVCVVTNLGVDTVYGRLMASGGGGSSEVEITSTGNSNGKESYVPLMTTTEPPV